MKVDALNAVGLLLALAAAMLGSGLRWQPEPSSRAAAGARPASTTAPAIETMPDGVPALRDAQGVLVPLRPYRRIASGTLIADRVLADLCEPDRIVAFTRYAAQTASAHRYAGKPAIGARDDVERVLALAPELLFVNDLIDPHYVARLREHGVQVFDLGPMRGLSTLLPNIRAIGMLIGAPERAARYADTLQARLRQVARAERGKPRPRALYLGIYGDKLFGAAADTSYHDVIEYAGLADAAGAAGLTGWPELTSERVLVLDPDLLITRAGMAGTLCRHPGLDQLRPCRAGGHMVELPGALLDDPGPAMLDAAEALHDEYWFR
jgi:iron complex transport system substrate-binding protein